MSKFRDGMIGPTIILLSICLVITFALAGVYTATKDTIAMREIEAANDARMRVLTTGETFTEIAVELPDGVTDAYRADNGTGYVFTSQAKGFGGEVVWVIGMDADGGVTGIDLFSHEETPGLGTKVGEADYLAKYLGDVDPSTVDAVTGATRTSNSLKNAVSQARAAYEIVKGA